MYLHARRVEGVEVAMGGLLCKNANIANENIEVALIKAVRVSLPEQRKARENYSWIDFLDLVPLA